MLFLISLCNFFGFLSFIFLITLLLFNYSCLHFSPTTPPNPSQTHFPPLLPPSPLVLSLCPSTLYFLLNHFHCYSIIVVPIFPPLLSSVHPTVNSHTVVHLHGSFIHDLCLVPSPSFHCFPPSASPLVTFSLFHVSMLVVLYCSWVYFVY